MESMFASDVELLGQYYAAIIRAEHIGKIIRIELPTLSYDESFITKSDIKGENAISLFGQEMPIFAKGQIEYIGQALGVLVANSEERVLNLAKEIVVVVEQNEEVENFALKKEDVEKAEEIFKEQIISKREKVCGDIDECFKDENSIVSSFLHFSPRSHYMAEPLSVKIKAKQNSLDVYVPTQWADHVQQSVARAIDVEPSKVKVIPTNEACSLEGRIWFPSLIATQLSIAAYVLKKNIALTSSFKESFLYSPHSPRVAIRHKSVLNAEKTKIEAMSVLCVVDSGAFNLLFEEILTHIFLTSISIYSVPIYEVRVIAIKREPHLTDVFINFGEYYTNTAIEKHISDIVDAFGLDSKQFRLDNIIKMNEESVRGKCKKNDYKIEALLDKAISNTTFSRKYAAYKAFNRLSSPPYEDYLRGAGIAIGVQYNGLKSLINAGAIYTVQLELTKDMHIIVKAEPSSEELKSIFRRKIEKELDIPPSNIVFENIKNIEGQYIGPSIASCANCLLPLLLDKCIAELQKQRFREPLPIVVTKDYKITGRSGWDGEKMEGQPFASETAGACVVELKFEKSTYNVKVQNIYIIVDGGEVFSREYIASNVSRAVSCALSGVLKEKMPTTYNRASDYTIISANEMPDIQIKVLESRSSQIKDVSTLAFNLVVPAFISALNQILKSERLSSIPILQQDIFDIMENSTISFDNATSEDKELQDEPSLNIEKEKEDVEKAGQIERSESEGAEEDGGKL